MKVVYSKEFAKEFKKLPANIQRLYRKQEDIFKEDWRDPRLKVKKLKDHPLPFSFRITRGYVYSSSSSNQIPFCLLLSAIEKMFTTKKSVGEDKVAICYDSHRSRTYSADWKWT